MPPASPGAAASRPAPAAPTPAGRLARSTPATTASTGQIWRNTANSQTGAYVTYSYDTGANATGRLSGETFNNANVGGSLSGCYAFAYDARGQVTAMAENVGTTICAIDSGYTTHATYNDASQLTSQAYPNNDVLTPSYDSVSGWQNGLSVQLYGSGNPIALLTSEAYSGAAGAMGLLTHATLGAFTSGSGAYDASYDALGRLTSGSYTYASSPLYQVQPTYDALSNVIETVTTLPQGTDTQVFCYDDLSRLTWAGSTGTPACAGAPTPSDTSGLVGTGAQYSAAYSYDSMNRLTSSPLGASTYGDSAHADAATAIGASWTASYDAAGNMTCRAPTSATTCAGASPTGAQLGYDNEGQLATWQNAPSSPTSTTSFLYDGEGQRIQQVATTSGGTTTTTYVGALEEITAPSGAPTSTTAYYGGLALSVNGALSYTLSDGLGSVSEAVATDGTVTATQLYGPYGAVRYSNGTLPGTLGYTGQRADAATGLDYSGARYYDPVAGQFTSADTMLAGGLNRYAYVSGNPETLVDPTGHEQMLAEETAAGGEVEGTPPVTDGPDAWLEYDGPTDPTAPQEPVTVYGPPGGGGLDGNYPGAPSGAGFDIYQGNANGTITVTSWSRTGAFIALATYGKTDSNWSQIQQTYQQGLAAVGVDYTIHQNNRQTGENDTPKPTPEHGSVSTTTDEGAPPPTDTSGAGARKGGGGAYVIGESMSRIYDYLSTHDVQYYRPWMKGAKNSLLVRNARWILWLVRSGATIYNIGFDSDRQNKSLNYLLEVLILQALDYPVIYDPQPGSGKDSQP